MSSQPSEQNQKPAKKKLGPKDFTFTALLGEGSYARVYLATHKADNKQYAAKIVSIAKLKRLGKTETAMRERKCLAITDHPNIVKLHYTFRDKQSLYYILEMISEGELFELIEAHGKLDENLSQFFAAEIVSCVSHLHKKGILHRDLKPENLLLTKGRHLKLTDFGTAGFFDVQGKKEEAAKTEASIRKSFVGTAEYVAPEVLEGKGQTGACDIWSIGCIIYHMMVGKPPFKGASEYLTLQKIKECKPEYPSSLPGIAVDLFKKILVPQPSKRITMEEIQKHPFFRGIEWETVNLGENKPPEWKEPNTPVKLMPLDSPDADSDFEPWTTGSLKKKQSAESQKKEAASEKKGKPVLELESFESLRNLKMKTVKLKYFLNAGETVVFAGLIVKRSFRGVGIFSKKRELILTNTPRILYVDPRQCKVKGEIPWTSGLEVEAKTRKTFVIRSQGKQYSIKCVSHEAQAWVDQLNSRLLKLNKDGPRETLHPVTEAYRYMASNATTRRIGAGSATSISEAGSDTLSSQSRPSSKK